MNFRKQLVAFAAVLLASTQAFADRVVRVEIRASPDADATEFGLIYSNTGLIPANLELYCRAFEDEPGWDGTAPSEPKLCGRLDLQVRLSSIGLSAFLMKAQPLSVRLHVHPQTATLRSVLGTYVGAKALAGVAAGGRTMVLRNEESGVWATTGQALNASVDRGYGLDLSMPWFEVYSMSSHKPEEMQRTLDSFVQQTSANPNAPVVSMAEGHAIE